MRAVLEEIDLRLAAMTDSKEVAGIRQIAREELEGK
jgi:hypothetical protein